MDEQAVRAVPDLLSALPYQFASEVRVVTRIERTETECAVLTGEMAGVVVACSIATLPSLLQLLVDLLLDAIHAVTRNSIHSHGYKDDTGWVDVSYNSPSPDPCRRTFGTFGDPTVPLKRKRTMETGDGIRFQVRSLCGPASGKPVHRGVRKGCRSRQEDEGGRIRIIGQDRGPGDNGGGRRIGDLR